MNLLLPNKKIGGEIMTRKSVKILIDLRKLAINSYGMSVAARQQIGTKVQKTCNIFGHVSFFEKSGDIIRV